MNSKSICGVYRSIKFFVGSRIRKNLAKKFFSSSSVAAADKISLSVFIISPPRGNFVVRRKFPAAKIFVDRFQGV
ncbi:MAG: hypothetical protein SR2Q5_06705 [Quinella sp. 2Q5]|nr:hypothetical protein [Quinella sp. 2Q5]